MLAMLVGLLSQSLVIPVMSITVEDQKNYYTPDPHAGTPPSGFSDSLCNPLTYNISSIFIQKTQIVYVSNNFMSKDVFS